MKLVALALMLTVSVAFAADAKVPAVVGIWRVDMEGGITTSPLPSTSTGVPVTTTKVPVTTTAVPVTTTKAPVTTTAVPVTTTKAPVTTTAIPVTTTAVPVTTTAVPVTTTAVPVTTTAVPVTTTAVPVTTTAVPVTTTAVPVTTTAVPVTTTAVPVTTTAVPVTTTAVPVTTAVPATTTAVPVTTTAVPVTTTAVPVTTTAVPVTTTAVPVTTTAVPVTTTAVPVTTTAGPVSTSQKPEDPGHNGRMHHPRFPEVILNRHKRAGEMIHHNVFICTGTMVNKDYVLTTEACAIEATSNMGMKVSAGVDSASPDTPAKNLVTVIKTSKKTPLALLQVKQQSVVTKPLHWTEGKTAINTACQFVYWEENKETKVITQTSRAMTTVACKAGVTNRICVMDTAVVPPPTRDMCKNNLEGGVLVCKEKVVAMYGKYNEADCRPDVTAVELYEVFQQDTWLQTTAGASTVTLSALIGLVAVAICGLFN